MDAPGRRGLNVGVGGEKEDSLTKGSLQKNNENCLVENMRFCGIPLK